MFKMKCAFPDWELCGGEWSGHRGQPDAGELGEPSGHGGGGGGDHESGGGRGHQGTPGQPRHRGSPLQGPPAGGNYCHQRVDKGLASDHYVIIFLLLLCYNVKIVWFCFRNNASHDKIWQSRTTYLTSKCVTICLKNAKRWTTKYIATQTIINSWWTRLRLSDWGRPHSRSPVLRDQGEKEGPAQNFLPRDHHDRLRTLFNEQNLPPDPVSHRKGLKGKISILYLCVWFPPLVPSLSNDGKSWHLNSSNHVVNQLTRVSYFKETKSFKRKMFL